MRRRPRREVLGMEREKERESRYTHAVTCPPSAPIVSSALPGGRALLSSVYLASPCLLGRSSLVVFAAGSLPAGTFRPGTRPMANSTRLCTPTQPTYPLALGPHARRAAPRSFQRQRPEAKTLRETGSCVLRRMFVILCIHPLSLSLCQSLSVSARSLSARALSLSLSLSHTHTRTHTHARLRCSVVQFLRFLRG